MNDKPQGGSRVEPGSGRAAGMLSVLSGGWGTATPRTKTPSGKLKSLLEQVVGDRYDRNPCPHSLVRYDKVLDPQRPLDKHRIRTRRTLVVCERPAGHEISPTEIERSHAGPGSTW